MKWLRRSERPFTSTILLDHSPIRIYVRTTATTDFLNHLKKNRKLK